MEGFDVINLFSFIIPVVSISIQNSRLLPYSVIQIFDEME